MPRLFETRLDYKTIWNWFWNLIHKYTLINIHYSCCYWEIRKGQQVWKITHIAVYFTIVSFDAKNSFFTIKFWLNLKTQILLMFIMNTDFTSSISLLYIYNIKSSFKISNWNLDCWKNCLKNYFVYFNIQQRN